MSTYVPYPLAKRPLQPFYNAGSRGGGQQAG